MVEVVMNSIGERNKRERKPPQIDERLAGPVLLASGMHLFVGLILFSKRGGSRFFFGILELAFFCACCSWVLAACVLRGQRRLRRGRDKAKGAAPRLQRAAVRRSG